MAWAHMSFDGAAMHSLFCVLYFRSGRHEKVFRAERSSGLELGRCKLPGRPRQQDPMPFSSHPVFFESHNFKAAADKQKFSLFHPLSETRLNPRQDTKHDS